MLVTDLEYLQSVSQLKYIKGGVYTYAKANANASSESAEASSLAAAEGDYTSVQANTSVVLSSGKYISYNRASASSFASAKTGREYSVSYDYALDLDVSVKH